MLGSMETEQIETVHLAPCQACGDAAVRLRQDGLCQSCYELQEPDEVQVAGGPLPDVTGAFKQMIEQVRAEYVYSGGPAAEDPAETDTGTGRKAGNG